MTPKSDLDRFESSIFSNVRLEGSEPTSSLDSPLVSSKIFTPESLYCAGNVHTGNFVNQRICRGLSLRMIRCRPIPKRVDDERRC